MAEKTNPEDRPQDSHIQHATCVAYQGRAVLIQGASGSGKSALALQLLAFGARLVADDRTVLTRDGTAVIASVPPQISGLIEARGVGLLTAEIAGPTALALVVDLDHVETERLPQPRHIQLLGQTLPLIHQVKAPHFPASILQFLACGRYAP